jgi:uncharacterized protein YndB with AHSA1/START domain
MTIGGAFAHHLERTVVIQAQRETVFRYFTDTTRWAAWWGAGSTIDARPGGQVVIRYPTAIEARGEVIELVAPERIVFTYGYASGHPVPPGGSRVTIRLEADGSNTRLRLKHEFDDIAVIDEHAQGWRYQLSLFANLVANELHANAGERIDAWFTAWSQSETPAREATLARIAAPDVRFRDRFSCIDGLSDLSLHLAAAQRFMAVQLVRVGEARHCQGMVLSDWMARSPDGQERARGTNVFIFNASGRIESVTGFWNQHPRN